MGLTPEMILAQSKAAYGQWKETWRKHAKIHSKYAMKPFDDFENIGIGKAVVCAATGWSMEREIDTLREHQGQVDIICNDKSLGHLLDHGITPTYCFVADARVSYEKYLLPWKDKVKDVILFQNVCGNPAWTEGADWKDRYFYCVMDVLQSEREFSEISGCKNIVAAGTNVSNGMVILLTQCDNTRRRNLFGYDKLLLVGFDYCWRPDGHYYAFDPSGGGKAQYMRDLYGRTIGNDYCFTSSNLAFSAQWLEQYVKSFKLPVVQCSKDSVLGLPQRGTLSKQMQYNFRRSDQPLVRELVAERYRIAERAKEIQAALGGIGRDHHFAVLASI